MKFFKLICITLLIFVASTQSSSAQETEVLDYLPAILAGQVFDNDGDGYSEVQGDCMDTDDTIYPGAFEICGDGIDQDCDGTPDPLCPEDIDNDGDGYTENQGDCNDNNSSINPNAEDVCGDGIDQDCDGSDSQCNGGGGAGECENVAGVWTLVVTDIDSTCGPEPGWESTVTITQNVCTLVTTGIKETQFNVAGIIDGNAVTVGPADFQDGEGITTSTFNMTLESGGTSMSGTETWTWASLNDSCSNGTANVTATKSP